jgi:hypothetical protein
LTHTVIHARLTHEKLGQTLSNYPCSKSMQSPQFCASQLPMFNGLITHVLETENSWFTTDFRREKYKHDQLHSQLQAFLTKNMVDMVVDVKPEDELRGCFVTDNDICSNTDDLEETSDGEIVLTNL